MKIFFNKTTIILQTLIVLFIGVSCSEEEAPAIGQAAGPQTNVDSYVQILTPVVSFVAGTPEYTLGVNAIGGLTPFASVEIYSTFTDAELATGLTSEEVLLGSYPVTDPTRSILDVVLTYADLAAGITIGGNPLPADELEVALGAIWNLRLVGVYPDGTERAGGGIVMAVLSPFAGLYTVQPGSAYFRINIDQGPFDGEKRFIGSVDDDTFVTDHIGPLTLANFDVDDATFDVDYTTNVITFPTNGDGYTLLGSELRDCVNNPGDFVNVTCRNELVPDPVNARHTLFLTAGYLGGGGVREFFVELLKD